MSTLHLRKTNSPGSSPRVVDWIVKFDDRTGICTECTTLDGAPSGAFLGKHQTFINNWLNIGKVGNVSYHEIVDDFTTRTPIKFTKPQLQLLQRARRRVNAGVLPVRRRNEQDIARRLESKGLVTITLNDNVLTMTLTKQGFYVADEQGGTPSRPGQHHRFQFTKEELSRL